MCQLFIVQGEDLEERTALFRRGLSLFQCLAHLRPMATAATAWEEVAVFPFLKKATPGIVEDGESGWICGAGCWFFNGIAGEEALRAMAWHGSRNNGPLNTWLKEIDGIFTIALAEPNFRRLRLITDRTGSLHAYTARSGLCALISTSSLVLAALIRPAWDLVACREFLATGTVFESRTLFNGIEKLPPATVIDFANGSPVSRHRYWDLAGAMYGRAPESGNVHQLASALEDAVLTIGCNFARPLLDLTGGLDSRAILGAVRHSGQQFHTVVNGDPDHPDVIASQNIATRLRLFHHRNSGRFTSRQSGGSGPKRRCHFVMVSVMFSSTPALSPYIRPWLTILMPALTAPTAKQPRGTGGNSSSPILGAGITSTPRRSRLNGSRFKPRSPVYFDLSPQRLLSICSPGSSSGPTRVLNTI